MIASMITRVFLGWDAPFLKLATAWMMHQGANWSETLMVAPTAQSGRRLREALAEKCGGAILSPKTTTPGKLLRGEDAVDICEGWEEELAWVSVLESLGDWGPYQSVMPEPDRGDSRWMVSLASEFTALRKELQENGMTLRTAGIRLTESIEAARWRALGDLEEGMLAQLRGWGLRDRSRPFTKTLPPISVAPKILLAGVTDLPPLVAAALEQDERPITVLIAAPETEQEHFSACGVPLGSWTKRELAWPVGSVYLASDPQHQATMVVRAIAECGATSAEIAVGCADVEVGEEVARALALHGWSAFHPAAAMADLPLVKWWRAFGAWLQHPDFIHLGELLAFSYSGKLVGGKRFQKSETIYHLMDSRMVRDMADLKHLLEMHPTFLSDLNGEKVSSRAENACALLDAAAAMERWRARYGRGDFIGTTRTLLEIIATTNDPAVDAMLAWMERAEPMIDRFKKPAGFWIDVMLSTIAAPSANPPENRVIDVQGWLEVFHEPGKHLVLCGLNEGRVPSRSIGETWLGEAARGKLGLITNDTRAARDAFLFHSMVYARMVGDGTATLISGKFSLCGDALLPSRLLLTGEGNELANRVKALFKEVEPPDAGLRRTADDWKWRPPAREIPQVYSATVLGSYLACPFRFYLKHVMRMKQPEPLRGEWNARDFGNIIHKALENWGKARELHGGSVEAIAGHLMDETERLILTVFNDKPPLAVRIQREAVHQRLCWAAHELAEIHLAGWEVIETEKRIKIHLPSGTKISGVIDRIDRHRETGKFRILDYKTGNLGNRKTSKVESAHRIKASDGVIARYAHLPEDCPAWHEAMDKKGRPRTMLWENLQLPLYAAAVAKEYDSMPEPCYLTIGDTREHVGLHLWDDFQERDMDGAITCAEWIVKRIKEGVFMPPAEKPRYDDFEILAAGAPLAELVEWV